MGSSSKKHKSEKKRKRSRSPERERERHRHHKKHRSHRHRHEEIEIISSSGSDIEEVVVIPPSQSTQRASTPPPPPPPVISKDLKPESFNKGGDGKSHDSLSIEDTNALRAKLGLKPLQVGVQKPSTSSEDGTKYKREAEDGTDMGEFVHKPAKNLAETRKSEKLKEKLEERKAKRHIEEKLKTIKSLGESDSDDDTKDWVKKSREREKQRKEAEKRAKLLEEMDQEFGVGALVEKERVAARNDLYTNRNLTGLKVGHSFDGIEQGQSIVLTLKDKNVLFEEDDVLINVNLLDNERYKKNVQRKLKKPGTFYDNDEDEEMDPLADQGKDVLSKYNEEIEGEKEDSFVLGEEMTEAQRAKRLLTVKRKLKQRNVFDLNSDLRMASDYYTEEEVSSKFKKPKKVKLRKKPKVLKAEDLMPVEDGSGEDLGHRKREPDHDDFILDTVKGESDPVLDTDDVPIADGSLSNIKIEPDEAELELQLALNKARKLKQKEAFENPAQRLVQDFINSEPGTSSDPGGGSIVLNSTAEFCRTLGDIPTYGLSGNREEEEDLLDFEREMKEEAKKREEDRRNRGAWSQVELGEPSLDKLPTDVPILDEEPDVGRGVAGALRLALSKGYLEKESGNRPSASRFAHLQAQNYSIEDKSHVDDEKFGRRDRFMGPASDFKEKSHYKPNVKLDYIDDDGRILHPKEAFRYLSHKFHGKGPGKNKVEKRMKKNEQEVLMKQMSSSDTPLRTLTMLQNKQKETQSAYIVLSGNKQAQATISKSK